MSVYVNIDEQEGREQDSETAYEFLTACLNKNRIKFFICFYRDDSSWKTRSSVKLWILYPRLRYCINTDY